MVPARKQHPQRLARTVVELPGRSSDTLLAPKKHRPSSEATMDRSRMLRIGEIMLNTR